MTETRPISWIKAARKEFETFPEKVQTEALVALTIAAEGAKADSAKPLRGLGSGIFEIVLRDRSGTYRATAFSWAPISGWFTPSRRNRRKASRHPSTRSISSGIGSGGSRRH